MPVPTGSFRSYEHDGDGCGRPLRGEHGRGRANHKQIDLQTEHLSDKLGKAFGASFRKSRLDYDILPLDVP